jgi:hypothetical protein
MAGGTDARCFTRFVPNGVVEVSRAMARIAETWDQRLALD